MRRFLSFIGKAELLVAVAGLAAGCGGSSSGSARGNEIVAAFYPLAFAAEQIAEATINNLVYPGGILKEPQCETSSCGGGDQEPTAAEPGAHDAPAGWSCCGASSSGGNRPKAAFMG